MTALMNGAVLDPYGEYKERVTASVAGWGFDGTPIPLIPGVIRVHSGVDWDAVRVPPELGERALEALGTGIGPVLASGYSGQWTFFINRGYADRWDLRGVRLLRRNTVVELPLTTSRASTRDVRWVVPPGGWTDPDQLYRALGGTDGPPAAVANPTGRKPRTGSTKIAVGKKKPPAKKPKASTARAS
ncbi:hypothetical protein ABZ419_03040 [Streptomyces cinnamoneus]|uniref:hypothetical protein n=1 Tax=Streptomyces cinnamoneus TaxID=53446 RepID=UPI0033FAC653